MTGREDSTISGAPVPRSPGGGDSRGVATRITGVDPKRRSTPREWVRAMALQGVRKRAMGTRKTAKLRVKACRNMFRICGWERTRRPAPLLRETRNEMKLHILIPTVILQKAAAGGARDSADGSPPPPGLPKSPVGLLPLLLFVVAKQIFGDKPCHDDDAERGEHCHEPTPHGDHRGGHGRGRSRRSRRSGGGALGECSSGLFTARHHLGAGVAPRWRGSAPPSSLRPGVRRRCGEDRAGPPRSGA